MLSDFLVTNRSAIIERARVLVARRAAPQATTEELQHGVPLFLDQLVKALLASSDPDEDLMASAARHGEELQRMGFTIAQVVYDYGDVCQAVTELAELQDSPISPPDFRVFNARLDDAIAGAVTAFTRLRERASEDKETERLGTLVHELRNCLSAATLSFQMLQTGKVAARGSTGGVLERNLRRMREIIARTLAEVRIDAGIVACKPITVKHFIEDIEVSALMDARARDLRLTITPVEHGVEIFADELLLTAAVTNVLQNAFKFTRPGGQVWLRTVVSAERVAFEVEDECGGLPANAAQTMFRPFEQHGADRSGIGLGLTISRRGVVASGGELRVRDLPGKGCVFTVEFPRAGVPAAAAVNMTTPYPSAAAPALRSRRVLIVENEVDAARALHDILELEGHDVRAVNDGAAALAAVATQVPDVVLLDLGLPRMDGYATCKALRALVGRGVLLVALTASQADRARLDEAGFDAYLVKPIDLGDLLTMLATSGVGAHP